jgi:hypothetical protein
LYIACDSWFFNRCMFQCVVGLIYNLYCIYIWMCFSSWKAIERTHWEVCYWRWSFHGILLIIGVCSFEN